MCVTKTKNEKLTARNKILLKYIQNDSLSMLTPIYPLITKLFK